MVRTVAVVVALAVFFATPVWTETGRGYAVVPIWWPESGASRSLIWPGAIIDALAVLVITIAVFWPRVHR